MSRVIFGFLLIYSLTLVGCGSSNFLSNLKASSTKNAYDLISAQNESLRSLTAHITLEALLPQGKFRISGTLTYEDIQGTKLVIQGPFGMSLAELQINATEITIMVPTQGIREQFVFGEKDFIAEAGVDVGFVSDVSKLLLPVFSATSPSDWKFGEGNDGDPGYIYLNSKHNFGERVLVLLFKNEPVRLVREDFMENGKALMSKSISYDEENLTDPDTVSLSVGEYSIEIEFNSLKARFNEIS